MFPRMGKVGGPGGKFFGRRPTDNNRKRSRTEDTAMQNKEISDNISKVVNQVKLDVLELTKIQLIRTQDPGSF